ncbi:hypothetical protein [Bdellovibrio bacteriovorus]|uniref:GIY-YIG domain-containing protein n=1 Tax=Bdellovibrio bacteriovorus str. Tiberius TaxID=1069642 RepID=K7YYY7_BDEBC|nr:hypothetical protein [Bdellovibrio bacteriovorus]AFY02928.1 Hypothetical protein Bdt_3253 [Bdellovibrio bacteriovorus str. Tiberius]
MKLIIKSSGLANYLNGKSAVSEKTLKKYLEKYFGNEHIDPLFELAPLASAKSVPNDSGLYALYDSSKKLLYFGKASRLKVEMNQTLNRAAPKQLWALASNKATYRQPKFKEMVTYFSVYKVTPDSSELRHHLESFVLRVVLNSTMNQRTGKLKVR